jgi:recombination protein U
MIDLLLWCLFFRFLILNEHGHLNYNNIVNYYLNEDIAVIHKKPTPITIVHVDYPQRSHAKITEAYFKVPSTTDYNGIYRGKYIDFEAKECASRTSFPLQATVHPHQIRHLDAVMRHGAVAFMIIRFTVYDETYLVDADKIVRFWNNETRRSIPYSWFRENAYLIPTAYLKPVDYLQIVDRLYFSKEVHPDD